jgi:hypothetical protein
MIIRDFKETDKDLFCEWMLADDDHKDLNPDDWLSKKLLVFEDDAGIAAFIRINPAARIDMQMDTKKPLRNAKALSVGFPMLECFLSKAGCLKIEFDSKVKALVAFFTSKRFGFKHEPNLYEKVLPKVER